MENDYVLFPKAQEDLENIFKYISVTLANKDAALHLINKFEAKFNSLALFPNAYPQINHPGVKVENARKCRIDNFMIIYVYDDANSNIEIIRIVHCKQNIYRML
jgi:addiction module RelE/StbE family toxin